MSLGASRFEAEKEDVVMTDLKTGTVLTGRPGSGAHRVVALCGPYLSGKTSLLESLLFAMGTIGRRGSTRLVSRAKAVATCTPSCAISRSRHRRVTRRA